MSTDDTMRQSLLRKVLLLMLAGMVGPGCAKEDLLMGKVDVHAIFADDRVAELADAIVEDDAARVHRLARGANLAAKGDKNVTLLQWAVLNQSLSSLEALLQEGADPRLQGMDGYTVLHTAAMVDDPRYLDLLLRQGSDPDMRDAEGQTALGAAVMARREVQVTALLKAGADPNLADSMGDRPLHTAGLINDARLALILLEAGADPRARNRQGTSFQRYLFKTEDRLLNDRAKAERADLQAWLGRHGIPLETPSQ